MGPKLISATLGHPTDSAFAILLSLLGFEPIHRGPFGPQVHALDVSSSFVRGAKGALGCSIEGLLVREIRSTQAELIRHKMNSASFVRT